MYIIIIILYIRVVPVRFHIHIYTHKRHSEDMRIGNVTGNFTPKSTQFLAHVLTFLGPKA
jgi:hypothetical protein